MPLRTPSGKGLYLTVHPLSCPNTDKVLSLYLDKSISIINSHSNSHSYGMAKAIMIAVVKAKLFLKIELQVKLKTKLYLKLDWT